MRVAELSEQQQLSSLNLELEWIRSGKGVSSKMLEGMSLHRKRVAGSFC